MISNLVLIRISLTILFLLMTGQIQSQSWEELEKPINEGIWLRPSSHLPAQPVWGFKDGLQVGLAPMPGPRGLLRIYTPYLGHRSGKMINFIAIEPIPTDSTERGFSELEMSALDSVRGKRFWSANDSTSFTPGSPSAPARGVIGMDNEQETLTVFIFSEPFENGAQVYVRLRFYENNPYEAELKTYTYGNSVPLKTLILTATMGNFARLRTLYLKEGKKHAEKLWPDYTDSHFTSHDVTRADEMIRDSVGNPYFIASPNEPNPSKATYSADTNPHWKYYGKTATQYWYKTGSTDGLLGLVNGRFTYWASTSPIPGGIAFENFELTAPFSEGSVYIFGVSPLSSAAFIRQLQK